LSTLFLYDTDRIGNASNNSSAVVCIRCCNNVFNVPLPSNDGGIYITDRDRWEGFIYFMKYAVQMASGVMIHIPTFIKIGSGIQKLMKGIHIYKDSMVIS
jgi:hypothetical protein